jgi:hypothetical protein
MAPRLRLRSSRLGPAAPGGAARPRAAILLLGVGLLVAACGNPDAPTIQGQDVPLPSPLVSLGPTLTAVVADVEAALVAVGSRLDDSTGDYRPSEPTALVSAPRVVLRADLADADDGFVLVYDAADAAQAATWAADLAAYLGSGYGQASYAADSRFSVASSGDAVIFTTWSPSRSSDPAAQAAFEAVASVGEAVEVAR